MLGNKYTPRISFTIKNKGNIHFCMLPFVLILQKVAEARLELTTFGL